MNRRKDLHLPQCVYLRHGSYWQVKGGKWTKLGRTLKDALREYAALYESPAGTLGALIDEALADARPRIASSTFTQYVAAGRILKRKLAEFSAPQVKQRDVAAVKKALAAHPSMANRCLTVLRVTFNYALEHELVEGNPAVGVKPYQTPKRKRLLSIQEIGAIYAKAGPRLQVIIDLLIRTGKRVNDVLRIRRADLLEQGIRFYEQKTGTKNIVPWTPELRAVVDRAKTLHGNIMALTLLHNRRGKTPDYSTVKIQWDKARKAAGIEDAHLHDLRAVAATFAKKQGKNQTALLGHSSPAQTVRYLREKEESVAEGPSFGNLFDHADK